MCMLKMHLSTQQSTDEVHLMDMATGTADFALEAMRQAFQTYIKRHQSRHAGRKSGAQKLDGPGAVD